MNYGKLNYLNPLENGITSFCARIYGQSRIKRKTEDLIKELKKEQLNGSSSLEDKN